MLLLHVLLFLSLSGRLLSEEESIQEDTSVLKLTLDNFDDVIGENTVILVEFFAPWCGHCKRLAPEYEAAAKELAEHTPPVPLATIDATEEKQLAGRFAIDGYPTLKVFHNGLAYDYEGPRTASGIVEYMKKEARPDWTPPTDPVLVLTETNFTETVDNSQLILVEFYAPWCGHCKKLAPEYSKAARDLLEHDIPLAKVDATAESALAQQFSVSGYPSLKVFRSGKAFEYSGPRERYGIVKYMLEQAKPASTLIETNKQFEQFLKSHQDPVVVTFASSKEDSAYKGHDNMANAGRESPLTFGHSFNTQLAHHYELKERDTAIFTSQLFVSTNEPAVKKFEGDMTADNSTVVLQELLTSARPLVGLRRKSNEDWYSYPKLVAYLEVDTTKEGVQAFTYWRKQLIPLAREFFGRLSVVMCDEREYAQELEQLEMADWGEDVAMAIWADAKRKYPLRVEFEPDSIQEMIEDYFSGKLQPVLRTQSKPRKNDGPLTVVVGSTFEEIVLNSGKNVFIEFYAPWCGHCKALEPKYKKLAKKFKKNDNLIIAKFDATLNDPPSQFEFTGFPTIFFVSASNDITVYSEGREVDDMTAYLKKMTKKKKKTNKDEL